MTTISLFRELFAPLLSAQQKSQNCKWAGWKSFKLLICKRGIRGTFTSHPKLLFPPLQVYEALLQRYAMLEQRITGQTRGPPEWILQAQAPDPTWRCGLGQLDPLPYSGQLCLPLPHLIPCGAPALPRTTLKPILAHPPKPRWAACVPCHCAQGRKASLLSLSLSQEAR